MKQILLSILTLSLLSIITVNGQGVLPAESAFSLDPLITLISCLREDKPGYCLQRRALNFFESWLTSQGGDEDENPAEDETGERLPAGLSPYWSKIVDSIADKISGSMYGDGEEEEPEDVEDVLLKNQNNTTNQLKVKSRQGESQVEDGRGHKKKKRKAVKKAIIKLVLIALLIKHKIKMLLTAFHTFLAFKAALLTSILVVIHGIKLWIEIKHKHHPQKVIYYENAHHTHYDDHHDEHFDDHHNSGWNFWGRSGVEAPTSTPPPTNYYNSIASYLTKRSSTGADNLAYSAYAPQEIAKN